MPPGVTMDELAGRKFHPLPRDLHVADTIYVLSLISEEKSCRVPNAATY